MPGERTAQPMPWWARLTLGLTLLNSWVLFEETIVDRTGLSRWMPWYRVGKVCAWDVAASIAIAGALGWGAWRLGRARANPQG